jgi:hypothetical protein
MKTMKHEEIITNYPNQWVCLIHPKNLARYSSFEQGEVIAAADTLQELKRPVEDLRHDKYILVYVDAADYYLFVARDWEFTPNPELIWVNRGPGSLAGIVTCPACGHKKFCEHLGHDSNKYPKKLTGTYCYNCSEDITICPDCYGFWSLSERESAKFREKSLSQPRRCNPCRDNRRSKIQ